MTREEEGGGDGEDGRLGVNDKVTEMGVCNGGCNGGG
ncbi:hypothetical protein SLEP1_g25049 [Rubroshorea leprosula]|uniref:Uncharacterized protein n=1 Tax=Rubroshorea leprosula TaxID=152421 RepID=A0AAV5JHQ5_9ROSI|nr:hypothetical protein SLEP1_g25049 [Rubroshorea leprosula]